MQLIQKIFLIMIISFSTLVLTGCKETMDQIASVGQEQSSKDQLYTDKLKTDLKNFDQIRPQNNQVFFDLNDKLNKATAKQTSTIELRKELQDFADSLRNQNDKFKTQAFSTPEVAKLRNTIMQLNYDTIQILDIIDNPNTVKNRLTPYLKKQERLIHEYNKLRTEIESKI
ncbi:hypothetical protein CAP51_12735 [Acinetobacter populi]|uniref:Lipoprotein n=2 Tax=Acinetobacter populi TaxID=1582270 RepID=A0A1Z9YX44_9GAMM|nr:hypothetical protein CAP51_12735 [Acinetobacter populi]